jgi:predicted TIM-barrel fold metal-dependent hydrolase
MGMHFVDTHQHLWDLAQFPYSWCASVPKLNRSFRLDDYRAAAAGVDIVKTVFMEADVDEPHLLDEARHIQSLADQNPLIAGIIASCRPERDGFREQLGELSKLPKLRGVRRVLHTMPVETSQSPLFSDNLNLLPEFGLTFDLCVAARQLPAGIDLVRRCPNVTFVLDHCGVPDVKGKALDPWRDRLGELARFPNVNCKISGLVAYADPDHWTTDDLRPWVEHVLEQFGWDRVLWASDWPVCTLSATLKQWVDTALELTADASAADREKLFRRNAERIYRV